MIGNVGLPTMLPSVVVQRYVIPGPAEELPPSGTLVTTHVSVRSTPASATGTFESCVTSTEEESVQPDNKSVITTVYVPGDAAYAAVESDGDRIVPPLQE